MAGAESGCFPRKPALLIFSTPCAVGKPRLICMPDALPGQADRVIFHSYEMNCPNSCTDTCRHPRCISGCQRARITGYRSWQPAKFGEVWRSVGSSTIRDRMALISLRIAWFQQHANRTASRSPRGGCFSEAFLLPGNSSSHCYS